MRVSLFIPCLVDRFIPEIGQATVHLLEAVGCQVVYDSRQTCCGQPTFNAGYCDDTIPYARHLLKVFDENLPVVCPSGSCVAMVRESYGLLNLPEPDLQRWSQLRSRLFELSEFLVARERYKAIVHRLRARVTVHHSCHHLCHTNDHGQLAVLLGQLKGVDWIDSPQARQCCGFGGVFSMKLPELSVAMGKTRLAAMETLQPDYIALADAGCVLHLRGIQQARLQSEGPAIVHYSQLFMAGDIP